ncbi:hypothetical protein ACFLYT_01535 [Nanoarchaeota archaeon]
MEELENTFIEEYVGAQEQLDKERYKNATILFSKSLFALCDLLLEKKLKRLPKNHTERFRMLEEYLQEAYKVVDGIFSNYTDAYSKPVLKESCENIKDGIKKITNTNEVSEKIKEIAG